MAVIEVDYVQDVRSHILLYRSRSVCPLLVICRHFGDFGLSDGDQMATEDNGDFGVIFVFFGNFCI